MYNEFNIIGITNSLADNSIIIETNFTLNPKSVNMTTVRLKNGTTGVMEDYTLTVQKKNIVVQFTNAPTPNTRYFVSVTDIEDALERKLKNYFNQTVVFESTEVKYKVAITKPFSGEAIKDNTIEINVKATPDDEHILGYYYEIASDVAFCNPISMSSTSNTVTFTDIPTGQCFVRCRVQDINNSSIYGEWSNAIPFISLNEECSHDDDDDSDENPIIEDLLSLQEVLVDVGPIKLESIPGNGKTSQSFYIVFDKEIDPSSIPDRIVAYRRDL